MLGEEEIKGERARSITKIWKNTKKRRETGLSSLAGTSGRGEEKKKKNWNERAAKRQAQQTNNNNESNDDDGQRFRSL